MTGEKARFVEFVETMLETESLEDLLERFDMTPEEAMRLLYEDGHIEFDEDELEYEDEGD
jgi:hypothetical protein